MAVTKKIKTVFQFRRATTEEWGWNKTVVPAAGEPCYDLDLKTLRIGDGVTTYEGLPVIGGAELASDGKSIVLANGALTISGFDDAEVGSYMRKGEDGSIEWVDIPVSGDVQAVIEQLKIEIQSVQEDVTNVTENVTAIQDQVGDTNIVEVQESVNHITENVINLTTQIEEANTEIITIQETLESKADAGTVVALQTVVEQKADVTTVVELQTVMGQKADTETVVELQTIVEQKADTETVTELQTIVETKADTVAVEAMSTELKGYVDEQLKKVEVGNIDDGEI